mgnify:CR=1 FL=1
MNLKFIILVLLSLIPSYFAWLTFWNELYLESFLFSAASYLVMYLAKVQLD